MSGKQLGTGGEEVGGEGERKRGGGGGGEDGTGEGSQRQRLPSNWERQKGSKNP